MAPPVTRANTVERGRALRRTGVLLAAALRPLGLATVSRRSRRLGGRLGRGPQGGRLGRLGRRGRGRGAGITQGTAQVADKVAVSPGLAGVPDHDATKAGELLGVADDGRAC